MGEPELGRKRQPWVVMIGRTQKEENSQTTRNVEGKPLRQGKLQTKPLGQECSVSLTSPKETNKEKAGPDPPTLGNSGDLLITF